jgi:intracellular multiplication protein IcmE
MAPFCVRIFYGTTIMTDNFEEFEHGEGEHHEGAVPQPTGIRSNLSGAWRSQPLFKLFVLVVVVGAVVAVAVSLFSGNAGKSAVGLLKPPDLHEAPGGKSSPYLKEQTEMANKQRTDEAIQSGGSALPTPIGPGTDTGELSPLAQKEDPLNELRAEVENMNKQLQETKQTQIVQQAQAPAEPFDDSLAQAMQRQMGQLLDSWAPKGTRQVAVYDIDTLTRERQEAKDKTEKAVTASTTGGNPTAKTVVPAGTVSYAQLLTEANSDVPGPILAQVVSGPLKGARVVGQFQVANGYSDYLVLTFKLADMKGTDYRINAIALDPDTTLGGMATEVDQRYFMRLILPAAAGFLQGFASALGQGNSSISTNGSTTIIQQSGHSFSEGEYQGLSTAAQTAGQFFQNQANLTKPLVRVAAGTPMGLFFIDTVTDMPATQQPFDPNNPYGSQAAYPYGQQGYGNTGLPGYNNGYTGVSGAGYGNSGYPVLYPGAAQGYSGYNGYSNNSYGAYGGAQQSGGLAYPGSSVYYTH